MNFLLLKKRFFGWISSLFSGLTLLGDAIIDAPSYMAKRELFVWLMFSFFFIWSMIAIIINYLYIHIRVTLNIIDYMPIPGSVASWYVGCALWPYFPRISLWFRFFGLLAITVISALLGAHACLISSNIHLIDRLLLSADYLLHFDTLKLMAWVNQYPVFIKVLIFSYESWIFQVMLVPFILTLLSHYEEMVTLLIATLFSFLFGELIYYIWPSLPPAFLLNGHFFRPSSYILINRFNDLHHGLSVATSTFSSGLITFPSFHVINSTLSLYAIRKVKSLFFLLFLINIFLILATMMLGYHFLVDVIMGLFIVALSYYLAKRVCLRGDSFAQI